MGRQAFITRLALGRSALGPVDPQSLQDGSEKLDVENDSKPDPPNNDTLNQGAIDVAESSMEGGILARSCDYRQQYEPKLGYPKNASSEAAKRRWRHAVNDVLATVGVCISKGGRPAQSSEVQDAKLIDAVQLMNKYGLLVEKADMFLRLGTEIWITPLRQRIQVFKIYRDARLVEIIKTEWIHFGGLQFFLAGMPSAIVFSLLDGSIEGVTEVLFERLRNAASGRKYNSTQRQILYDTILDYGRTLVQFSLFALIAPLRYRATLQQLDLIPPFKIACDAGAYISTLATVYFPKQRSGYLSPLAFLALVFVTHRRKGTIMQKIADYIWAALPKPTHPDKVSMAAAHKDELNISYIAGLVDESNPPEKVCNLSAVDQLGNDLQSLGRNWQVFYDGCAELLRYFSSSRPPLLENPRAPESLRRDRGSTAPIDMASGDENGALQHDLPNHDLSSPSPSASPPQLLDHDQTGQPSTTSSAVPSPPTSPGLVELTHHNENGNVYVNVSIPQPSEAFPNVPPSGVGLQRTRSGNIVMDIADQHQDVIGPDQDQLHHREEYLAELLTGENLAPREYQNGPILHHRVTALSAYPAQSMAARLKFILSDVLYLPIEAVYVRSLAIAFLSSPAQSSCSTDAAARWKREVYAPWPWLPLGWRAGGLRGAGSYLGKMILVLGLQAGVSYLTWQVGMGAVWWIGKRYSAWTKPKSEESPQ